MTHRTLLGLCLAVALLAPLSRAADELKEGRCRAPTSP